MIGRDRIFGVDDTIKLSARESDGTVHEFAYDPIYETPIQSGYFMNWPDMDDYLETFIIPAGVENAKLRETVVKGAELLADALEAQSSTIAAKSVGLDLN